MKVGARPHTAPARVRHVPEGTYTGPTYAPVRPGAMDAYTLPSLVGGKPVQPAQIRRELHAPQQPPATQGAPAAVVRQAPTPAPAPMPTPAPAPTGTGPHLMPLGRPVQRGYVPRPGSYPAQVLAILQREGGHITYTDVVRRCGVQRNCIGPNFETAMRAGALVRVKTPEGLAFALPGTPSAPPPAPADAPAARPAPAPVSPALRPPRKTPGPRPVRADTTATPPADLAELLRGAALTLQTLASALTQVTQALPRPTTEAP